MNRFLLFVFLFLSICTKSFAMDRDQAEAAARASLETGSMSWSVSNPTATGVTITFTQPSFPSYSWYSPSNGMSGVWKASIYPNGGLVQTVPWDSDIGIVASLILSGGSSASFFEFGYYFHIPSKAWYDAQPIPPTSGSDSTARNPETSHKATNATGVSDELAAKAKAAATAAATQAATDAAAAKAAQDAAAAAVAALAAGTGTQAQVDQAAANARTAVQVSSTSSSNAERLAVGFVGGDTTALNTRADVTNTLLKGINDKLAAGGGGGSSISTAGMETRLDTTNSTLNSLNDEVKKNRPSETASSDASTAGSDSVAAASGAASSSGSSLTAGGGSSFSGITAGSPIEPSLSSDASPWSITLLGTAYDFNPYNALSSRYGSECSWCRVACAAILSFFAVRQVFKWLKEGQTLLQTQGEARGQTSVTITPFGVGVSTTSAAALIKVAMYSASVAALAITVWGLASAAGLTPSFASLLPSGGPALVLGFLNLFLPLDLIFMLPVSLFALQITIWGAVMVASIINKATSSI